LGNGNVRLENGYTFGYEKNIVNKVLIFR